MATSIARLPKRPDVGALVHNRAAPACGRTLSSRWTARRGFACARWCFRNRRTRRRGAARGGRAKVHRDARPAGYGGAAGCRSRRRIVGAAAREDTGRSAAGAARCRSRCGRRVPVCQQRREQHCHFVRCTRLVYASGTPTRLFTRRLDQPTATELPGTQGAGRPFFSPDGQWVGFAAGNKINKMSVDGGAVVPVGEVAVVAGASWAEDGRVVMSEVGKGLLLPAAGGSLTIVAPLGDGEIVLAEPHALPGGKAAVFVAANDAAGGADLKTIEVLTLADGRRKILVRGASPPLSVLVEWERASALCQQCHAVCGPLRPGHPGDARHGRARAG